MKINQLFKEKVSEEVLILILDAFNLKGLEDDVCFSKSDLEKHGTVKKIEMFKDKLYQFYLPCKAKIYLEDINENKCITLLRQILKLFQVKLVSRQKYVKYKKTTIYSILKGKETHFNGLKVDKSISHQLFFNG
jgi:hypothetical protein